VDVHRHTVDATIQCAGVQKTWRVHKISPAFSFGDVSEVQHQASFDQFFSLTAVVQLSCVHWVTAQDA
jgi:hypothetical protein